MDKGITDKFGTTILTHLFCPHFGGKSSTEHHSASGFPPRSDEKIYANLADLILSVIPKILRRGMDKKRKMFYYNNSYWLIKQRTSIIY